VRNFTKGDLNLNETIHRLRPIMYLLLAFLAGYLCAGLFFNRQRFANIGILDKRYSNQHAKTAETIGKLEEELGRERELNRQLRR